MIERAIWWSGGALLLILLAINFPAFISGVLAIHSSPLFEITKTPESPPYSIGVLDSAARSLIRVLAGTAIGFSGGLLAGVSLAQLHYLGPKLNLLVTCLAPLAPVVWLPVLMKLIGLGDVTAVLVVASGSVFISTIIVYYLATHPKKTYVDILRTMRATDDQILRYVVLPSMVPMLMLLLRLNLFTGWIALLAAEMSGAEVGLGAMLILGRSLNNWSIIWLSILIIALLAFLLDRVVLMIASRIVATRYGGWLFVD